MPCLERSLQIVHLIDNTAESPKVGRSLTNILLKEFRRNIIGCADKCRFSLSRTHLLFRDLCLLFRFRDSQLGTRSFFLLSNIGFELFIKKGASGDFGGSEVDEFNVTIFGKHDIFRFEIPVGDAVFVQVFEDADNFRDVENSHLVGQMLVV